MVLTEGSSITILPLDDNSFCARSFPVPPRKLIYHVSALYMDEIILTCGGCRDSGCNTQSDLCHTLNLLDKSPEWQIGTVDNLPEPLSYLSMETLGNSGAVVVAGGIGGRI